MSKIQLEDFINYHFLSDITITEDGQRAIFSSSKQDLKENQYHSNLVSVNLKQKVTEQLTSFNKEKSFILDGEQEILFPTERSKADEAKPYHEKTCFYRLKLTGGEAYKAFEVNLNVQEIKKIPGTSKYAMIVLKDLNRLDPMQTTEECLKDNEDYIVLEEVPFWGNGRGYISRLRRALVIYDEKDQSLKQITSEYFHLRNMIVSPCGCSLIYSGLTFTDKLEHTSGLYKYKLESDETETLVEQGDLRIGQFGLTNCTLFYTATDMKKWGSGQNEDFYAYNMKDKTASLVAPYEYSIGSVISSDNRYGSGTSFKAMDGKIYFTSIVGTRCELYVLDQGKIERCFAFDGSVDCFDVNQDKVVFIGSVKDRLQEVYAYQFGSNQVERLTDFSSTSLKEKEVLIPKSCNFINRDKVEIDAWVIEPADFDKTKKYPGILTVHGGPCVTFGDLFFHEMQVWAQAGYFVYYCNPRGSDGKGNAFADIRGKYGTIDFHDLMDLTDHILQLYPQLDGSKLGVAGGSYGGFMTNWIIGNTDRFAAAASQRSVSNWISDYGTSEIGFSFDHNEMGATPWTDKDKMWDQSPLKHADKVVTPTLFIHSLEDYNCPISQGLEMFTALKVKGVPARVCLFKHENHELSRSGKPRHRIRRLKEITDWFDHYLK